MCSKVYLLISLILSIFLAANAAVLSFLLLLPFIRVAVWIALGFASAVLFLLLLLALLSLIFRLRGIIDCLYCNGLPLLISSFGTLFFSLVTLSIAPVSWVIAALVFIGASFFFFLLFALFSLLYCLIKNACNPSCVC